MHSTLTLQVGKFKVISELTNGILNPQVVLCFYFIILMMLAIDLPYVKCELQQPCLQVYCWAGSCSCLCLGNY